MKRLGLGLFLGSLLLVYACKKTTTENPLFQKLSADSTGVHFQNTLVEKDSLNILDYLYFYNGAGVATGDINNDGLTDVFFVSNNGKSKLYLNKGNLKFEDISAKAGIEGKADWKTGVAMADVNGDGLLDIYVSSVNQYRTLKGHNELFINNGNLTFTERAKEYGVDFKGFSTQAAFLDYDHDGDLDMYLLNHAVHTVSSYDKVSARSFRNNEAGDILYRNENGKKFTDVSSKAGIYGAAMGYGLGISIGDFNNDGWDDIFVSNDFHEDDYYYINNKNGTFTESVKSYFDHLSRFSMGNDAADFNNDGLLDIITMDMYADDEAVEKTSAGEDPLDVYMYKLQFGFYKQFARNCLHLNQGSHFSDIALMAGVAATDWSWSPLFADFDNDGIKDLFVSNGIKHRPNNLDYVKYITDTTMNKFMTEEAMRNFMGPVAQSARKVYDKKAIEYMPDGKVHNYMFKGTPTLQFSDKSIEWGFETPTYSNGAVYADLDNDGDLDIVTNELESVASIWENTRNQQANNNYLQVAFKGENLNKFGLGAKVLLKQNGKLQYVQNYSTRGFMSSVTPTVHFGFENAKSVDTLVVLWPSGKTQFLKNVTLNKKITLSETEASRSQINPLFFLAQKPLFAKLEVGGDTIKHIENPYYDFTREPLIPFKISTEGPVVAHGDINGDGLDDIYMPGAKLSKGKVYIQTPTGGFKQTIQPSIEADSLYEDVAALFFDADNDKDLDLYVVSGGNEYYDDMIEQFDRLYLNDGKGSFRRNVKALPPMYSNKSKVKAADFDKDGDLDLFVGGRVTPYHYGEAPESYLLKNDGKGTFTNCTKENAPALEKLGMITDATWFDYDNDNDLDLMVVGDWMPITLFENTKGKFTIQKNVVGEVKSKGFWQTIETGDFDKDGDIDVVVGNIGTNNKFVHDKNPILRMYVGDLDGNGGVEQILAYNRDEKFFPVSGKDDLGKRLPSIINKKFVNYKDFGGKTIEQLFEDDLLDNTQKFEVNNFSSVLLTNNGNKTFKMQELPALAQISKIFSILPIDIDQDQDLDLLIGGNFYNVSTYQGIYDAFNGLVLRNDKGQFTPLSSYQTGFYTSGEVRSLFMYNSPKGKKIAVSRNNNKMLFFDFQH